MSEEELNLDDLSDLLADSGGEGESSDSKAEAGNNVESMIIEFADQIASVVGAIINRPCKVSLEKMLISDEWNGLVGGENFAQEFLTLKTGFTGSFSGELSMVVGKKLTAILADLMMMGDGSAEYHPDHKDALGELFNQIMGATSTAFGSKLNQSISYDSSMVQAEGTKPDSPAQGEKWSKLQMTVEGLDPEYIFLRISPALCKHSEEAFASNEVSMPEESESEYASSTAPMTDLGESSTSFTAKYSAASNENVDMLMDVPLDITIELGRSDMTIKKVLDLGPGAIVELDKKASEPVDLIINEKVVAKGEVVVVDEYFGIRIVSLISPEERIKHLR